MMMRKKTVFLDRDGVINRERGEYTYKLEDFEVNEGIIESIKYLNENDCLVIIISNQGGISKGLYCLEDVYNCHNKLINLLSENGAWIDDFYFCPHYTKLENCLCRKPQGLMLEKAMDCYKINKSDAIFIGDSDTDVQAANNAGIRGVKINSNSNIYGLIKTFILETE